MNKKQIAVWTLATAVALSSAGTALIAQERGERGESKEPKVQSSVQVPKGQDDENDAALVKLAKLTIEEAMRNAQGAVAGRVIEAQLENEDGSLVYAIEILSGQTTKEVIIDAGNGAVLGVGTEAEGDEHEENDEK
jgi:uncharacterized membrane protein YkoI